MIEKVGTVADKSPKKLARTVNIKEIEKDEIAQRFEKHWKAVKFPTNHKYCSHRVGLDDQIEELRRENNELKDDICDSFADYTSRLEVQKDLAIEAFKQLEQKVEDASTREADLLERIASLEQMLKQKEIVQSPINLNNSR